MIGGLSAFVDLLVPDEPGRRAIEETLDDWREERARAGSPSARVMVNLRGLFSMLRVLCTVPLRDIIGIEVWRLFALTLLAATIPALIPLTIYVGNLPGALTISELVWLSVLLLPNAIATFAPLALALGLGLKRDRAAPVLATILVSVVFLIVMSGWIVPTANQRFRLSVLQTSAGQSRPAPAPGLTELNAAQLATLAFEGSTSDRRNAQRVINVRLALIVAAPSMFLLGLAVRDRFGARRWRLAQAAGPVAVVALVYVADVAAPVTLQFFDWPLAARLSQFNPELWMAMALTWVTSAGLLWRARNQTIAPRL
jgi:hypothetical protein